MTELQKKTYTIKIGTSDFKKLVTESTLFVDKTLLIKRIIEDAFDTLLITRPRRWGKTLNMTMLEYFFGIPVKKDGSIDEEERSKRYTIFSHLEIGKYPEIMAEYCGKYPTIFVSFKDAKGTRYKDLENEVRGLIYGLYASHEYLLLSDKLSESQKTLFNKFISEEFNLEKLTGSLAYLSELLFTHFGQKVMILIDEYDTPLNDWYALQLTRETISAAENTHFEEILGLFRGIFSKALKGKDAYVEKGVVTGILRIAKANLFSGVNNFGEDSILDEDYAPHFGFTETEVTTLLHKSDIDKNPETVKDLKSWYNGYNIGGLTIYNPWSIMNCIKNKGKFKAYWVGTGNMALIEQALVMDKFQEELQILVEGGSVEMTADPQMVFSDIKSSEDSFYNLLLFSGYLTAETAKQALDGITYICTLKIPNSEIRGIFITSIVRWIENKFKISSKDYRAFADSLLSGNVPGFMELLKTYLEVSASYFDSGAKAEVLYNGFMWGLFASSINEDYFVEKERESGKGRPDLVIIPKETAPYPMAVILEYKMAGAGEDLKTVSEVALDQIETKGYASKVKAYPYVKKILHVGLAFRDKEVAGAFK